MGSNPTLPEKYGAKHSKATLPCYASILARLYLATLLPGARQTCKNKAVNWHLAPKYKAWYPITQPQYNKGV